MAENQGSPVRSGSWCDAKPPLPSARSSVNARLNGSCSLRAGPVAVAVATTSGQSSLLTSPTAEGYGLGPTAKDDCEARTKLQSPLPGAIETSLSELLIVTRSSLLSRFISTKDNPCVCGCCPSFITIGEVGAIDKLPLPSPSKSITP